MKLTPLEILISYIGMATGSSFVACLLHAKRKAVGKSATNLPNGRWHFSYPSCSELGTAFLFNI